MIYNVIADKVNKIESDIASGSDINQAVIDNTRDLDNEVVKRIIEQLNINRFFEQMKKDRTNNFSIADPKIVLKKRMAGDIDNIGLKKSADIDSSFYIKKKQELCNIKLPIEKTTNIHAYGLDKYEVGKFNIMQKRAEMLKMARGECKDKLLDNMTKIAESIYNNNEKANSLFLNIRKDAVSNNNIDFAERFISSLCKLANVNDKYCRDDNLIIEDDLNFRLYKQSGRIGKVFGALTGMASPALRRMVGRKGFEALSQPLKRKQDEILGNLLEIKKNLSGLPSLKEIDKKISEYDKSIQKLKAKKNKNVLEKAKQIELKGKVYFLNKQKEDLIKNLQDQENEEAKLLKNKQELEELAKKKKEYEEEMGEKIKKREEAWSTLGKNISTLWGANKYIKALKGAIIPHGTEEINLEPILGVQDKINNVLKQQKVINSLLTKDEVLKERDPVLIAKLFKGLTKIAPHVAGNKEITRSFLRQISSQAEPTIDPYYATQLMKLESAMTGKARVTLA